MGYSEQWLNNQCREPRRVIFESPGVKAPDYVVFAERTDMIILGARTLEGMNVRVDALRKQLVPAGQILAGVA